MLTATTPLLALGTGLGIVGLIILVIIIVLVLRFVLLIHLTPPATFRVANTTKARAGAVAHRGRARGVAWAVPWWRSTRRPMTSHRGASSQRVCERGMGACRVPRCSA